MLRPLALFLNTCAFLLLETGLLRILAAAQWYHLAFLAISTALLGGGLGPVLLARRPLAEAPRERLLGAALRALPLLAVGSFFLFNLLPFEPLRLLQDAGQVVVVPLGYCLLALPFFLSGLVTALCFAGRAAAAPRLYFYDLGGAATGAVLFLLVLPAGGAYGVVLSAAALWAAAAWCIETGRRGRLLAAAQLALCLLGVAVVAPRAAGPEPWPLRITRTKTVGGRPASEVLGDPRHTVRTAYSTLGRVDAVRTVDGYHLLLDGGAALSRVPGPGVAARLLPDLRLLLALRRPRRVLVIGAGGGLEVQQALAAGAERVVAVEMNPLLLRVARALPVAGPYGDPRVHLVTDEARHHLAQSGETFDAILSVHTIANAALSSGGLSLAESYALTREAFADYLAHLAPDGLLFVTRPRGQMGRLVRTVAAAWAAAGRGGIADLAGHALAFAGADRFHAGLVLSPGALPAGLPEGLRDLGLGALPLGGLEREAALAAATDDRPFFNQRTDLRALRLADVRALFGDNSRLALEDRPVAELTLLALLMQLGLLGAVLFVWPLWRDRAAGGATGATATDRWRQGAYFFVLGLAFLLCEIALLQQLGLPLGQPAYTAPLVLGGLLLFSGLGSLRDRGGGIAGAAAGAALAVGLTALVLPLCTHPLALLPTPLRVLGALLLIAPSAYLMGRPFPRGLARLARDPDGGVRATAWAFAANGLASVLGSVIAPLLSMSVGLRAVLLCAAALYGLAAALAPRAVSAATGDRDDGAPRSVV